TVSRRLILPVSEYTSGSWVKGWPPAAVLWLLLRCLRRHRRAIRRPRRLGTSAVAVEPPLTATEHQVLRRVRDVGVRRNFLGRLGVPLFTSDLKLAILVLV